MFPPVTGGKQSTPNWTTPDGGEHTAVERRIGNLGTVLAMEPTTIDRCIGDCAEIYHLSAIDVYRCSLTVVKHLTAIDGVSCRKSKRRQE